VIDLRKEFPGVRAVDGISFSVAEGICFGLLGPNGAGKTTTVEMIEGIMPPSGGRVLYRGQPLGSEFRNAAGIQFQSTALQDFLTVRETLQMFRRLYPRNLAMAELIELCTLGEYLDRDARKLSGGQRQRLLLAIALANDPDILFLDEPTTGLDPQARRNFWQLIRDIRARGKTIILTTHYMDEAYMLCDRIAIMDHGRIIADGTPGGLLREHFRFVILEMPAEDLHCEPRALPFPVLQAGDRVEISTAEVNMVLEALLARGSTLNRLQIRPRTLEDLFLELTGNELRG
jgi:ABC-2 type transport system ATP-binding protein